MPTTQSETGPLLVFGAHPDDIEFGCGGVIARETRAGVAAHFVVCSRGEASTHGTSEQRVAEAEKAAEILGATIEFIDLGGDAHFEVRTSHAIHLAGIIRRVKPLTLLAPTPTENQHPDHARLGHLARDAARLARFGGLVELRALATHSIDQLFFYAITPDAVPSDLSKVLFDVSDPEVLSAWTSAMEAHATQTRARDYIELQLSLARFNGLRAGISHAIALYPNEPLVLQSLAQSKKPGKRF
jgi:N-acetylglucosamine malate deacetylase 1